MLTVIEPVCRRRLVVADCVDDALPDYCCCCSYDDSNVAQHSRDEVTMLRSQHSLGTVTRVDVATFTPASHDVDNDAFATWGAPDGSDTPCNASSDSATYDCCASRISRRTRLRLRCVPAASVGVTCTASTPSVVALDTRHGVFPLTVDIGVTTGVPKPGVTVTLPLPINEGASVYTMPSRTSTNRYRTPDVAFRDVASDVH